jgi:hypothetical protein
MQKRRAMTETRALTLTSSNREVIVPAGAQGDAKSRLGQFSAWLDRTGGAWREPDLRAYRDHLLEPLAPSTVLAHLSTIRGRYKRILLNNRQAFYALVPDTPGYADRKAIVDEWIERIRGAIEPASAPVKHPTVQDEADTAHLRLTPAQAERLMTTPLDQPRDGALLRVRDAAIVATMLCTGFAKPNCAPWRPRTCAGA